MRSSARSPRTPTRRTTPRRSSATAPGTGRWPRTSSTASAGRHSIVERVRSDRVLGSVREHPRCSVPTHAFLSPEQVREDFDRIADAGPEPETEAGTAALEALLADLPPLETALDLGCG